MVVVFGRLKSAISICSTCLVTATTDLADGYSHPHSRLNNQPRVRMLFRTDTTTGSRRTNNRLAKRT